MKAQDFILKALDIANNYKTLYVMGCFGAPMTPTNKKRYCNNHSYNKQKKRTQMINKASANTFGFDCVCLIKGILWGWNGNVNKTYGGAKYKSNGVPDVGANKILKYCNEVSTDFKNIIPGEIVWMDGHVGIYVGEKNVVECTPSWKNKVQVTKLSKRKWLKHGKLKFIKYNSIIKDEKLVYTVKKGDTLWNIAKTYLGSGLKYGTIKKLNNLKSNTIYPGQNLVIK